MADTSASDNKAKLAQLQADLKEVEANIFQLEQDYIAETDYGNIIRGWDDRLLSLKPYTRRRQRPSAKDRIFSQSSATAVATLDINRVLPVGSSDSSELTTSD